MSFETVRTFFALLALGANVAVVGYVVLRLMARGSEAAASAVASVHRSLDGYESIFGLVVALTATLGSLYLSEIVHLIPCTYCWYQRIAMYPLVVLFAVAIWRKDREVGRYAAWLAGIGLLIALWHYLIQRVPSLGGSACSVGVPCNAAYFKVFGFITIPYMAASAFALILVLLVVMRANNHERAAELSTSAV